MIWATVSSKSCFCWLYRVSSFSAAKNVISLITVLTIWCSPCVDVSYVVGKWGLLWPVCSLDIVCGMCASVYSCRLFLISSASTVLTVSVLYRALPCMKCSLDISNSLEISSLSHPIVFLYFFALFISGLLIFPCYSLELSVQLGISFPFSLPFCFSFFLSYV